jgi:hypothetical protein
MKRFLIAMVFSVAIFASGYGHAQDARLAPRLAPSQQDGARLNPVEPELSTSPPDITYPPSNLQNPVVCKEICVCKPVYCCVKDRCGRSKMVLSYRWVTVCVPDYGCGAGATSGQQNLGFGSQGMASGGQTVNGQSTGGVQSGGPVTRGSAQTR